MDYAGCRRSLDMKIYNLRSKIVVCSRVRCRQGSFIRFSKDLLLHIPQSGICFHVTLVNILQVVMCLVRGPVVNWRSRDVDLRSNHRLLSRVVHWRFRDVYIGVQLVQRHRVRWLKLCLPLPCELW